MNWKIVCKSTAVLMTAIIVSKLIGMARDIVLANYFGTSAVSDAYMIAVTVPTLLFYFIGHALSTAFLPMYNKIRCSEGEEKAQQYANNLMCIALAVAALIIAVLLLFPKPVVKVFAIGFDADTTVLAARFIQISAFSLLFMVVVNICSGYLHAQENYLIPAIISIPRNIVIIASIIAAAFIDINFLGIGILFSYIAEFMLLVPVALKNGYRFKLVFDISDNKMQETMQLVLPIVLGVAVSQINKIVDKSIASTLVEGGISALSYASVINNAVQEILVTGVITVLFSNCAALVAGEEYGKVNERVEQTIDTMFLLLIPATVGIIILAKPIVAIFFSRGWFDATSLHMTSSALQWYTVGLVFLAVRDALVKVFYAYKNTRVTTISSIAAIVLNIILNFVLSRRWGINGLAAATSASAVFQCILLYVVFNKKYLALNSKKLLIRMCKSIFASVFMAVCIILLHNFCMPSGCSIVTETILAIFLGGIIYFTIILLIDRQRLVNILRMIIR